MMRTMLRAITLPLLLTLAGATERSFEPTDSYLEQTIDGWTVRVSAAFRDHDDLKDDVLALLRARLWEVNRALPADARETLAATVVWVELKGDRFPGMCYHPSSGWLRKNGYNPDKAGGIEVGDARNFLDWSRQQPAMVLHELAHAYHDKVLGPNNVELKSAFDAAVRGGKYDAVLRANGRTERAYALNSPSEFFAELSEAYFGTNDFFPFVRAELKHHDVESFEVIRRLWER